MDFSLASFELAGTICRWKSQSQTERSCPSKCAISDSWVIEICSIRLLGTFTGDGGDNGSFYLTEDSNVAGR